MKSSLDDARSSIPYLKAKKWSVNSSFYFFCQKIKKALSLKLLVYKNSLNVNSQ